MFKVFQRWARVKEVFVSRRLNKWGRRFGFVRFFDVRNVKWLESELDQLYVGNRKLYVNVPKYRRQQMEAERFERKEPRKHEAGCLKDAGVEGKNNYGAQQKRNGKEVWVEKKGNKTFAEVVKGSQEGRWRGVTVKTIQKSLSWMERSIIGQFK